MNIQNLNSEEQKQLQHLLSKLSTVKEQIKVDPVDQMIDDILKNFDFGKVQTVMFKLNWKWATEDAGLAIPTIADLQECAIDLLSKAAKGVMRSKENGYNPDLGYTVGTGGLEATAYTNSNATEVEVLDLKFVLVQWDVCLGTINEKQ